MKRRRLPALANEPPGTWIIATFTPDDMPLHIRCATRGSLLLLATAMADAPSRHGAARTAEADRATGRLRTYHVAADPTSDVIQRDATD